MLTTGVDVPTCKNIVIARVINGMTEFKQIIGRGTRIRSDYGKLFFNILDYTGSATRLFAGRDFHADPVPPLEPEPLEPRREYYVDHGSVEIGTHVVYVLDPAGKVRSLYTSAADPFDLLCHIAFNAPLRTRRERAKLLRQAKKNFFDQYSPEARQVLNDILDKYIEYDIAQFKIPDILKLPPVSNVAPSPASSPSPCRTCSAR
jgi:type I restriction enzyme R subunit